MRLYENLTDFLLFFYLSKELLFKYQLFIRRKKIFIHMYVYACIQLIRYQKRKFIYFFRFLTF